MSDEIQKSRSPNSPKFAVEAAIETTKRLLDKIGKSSVKAETAVNALGYAGMNGTSLTTLSALSHYGLIERQDGEVRISPLGLKILHPVNADQKIDAIREAALNPRALTEIHEKWSDMEESALSNTLIHNGFTPEGAKRAASVYKANYVFAKLGEASKQSISKEAPLTGEEAARYFYDDSKQPKSPPKKMLATFKIPLGASEAELIFTGDKLEPADFDALAEYVTLFKKQYARKIQVLGLASALAKAQAENPPTE